MQYISYCTSPLGRITLTADKLGLTGLFLEGQGLPDYPYEQARLPIFQQVREWLELYFSGKEPDFKTALHITGTDFQKEVWEILMSIPFGTAVTYGEIARRLAERRGISRMSAQAVGAAVGRNPISIIIPCHRVIGSGGRLVGYAGGLDKKRALLQLEKYNGIFENE